MTTGLVSAAEIYWEERARRFATRGDGLAAVCSYGMPWYYNRAIHLCQRLALAPWLRVRPGTRVLDVGCGIGRWSRRLAARGAWVTGIDLSPTMIAEARRRAAAQGVGRRCRYLAQDLAALDAGGGFDLVLGVTVLQHILDPGALRAALARLASQLKAGGTLVLLEAAPGRAVSACDSPVFQARRREHYLRLFADCGLHVQAVSGVDPAPFKTWLLPHLPGLPRMLRTLALAAVTLLSLPIDVPFGRLAAARSWHAVFVLRRTAGGSHEAKPQSRSRRGHLAAVRRRCRRGLGVPRPACRIRPGAGRGDRQHHQSR
ncbi:MAG TPA: class I SAM-dependent methyltransferase [Steroidobacteraceae bacterium]|nr:class I SAM-dependent methyltransferase [Steroidobacteraceae bacterium]